MREDNFQVEKVEIQCLNPPCKQWFRSPRFFADRVSFETATLAGNSVTCPHCVAITPCNASNMKVTYVGQDGGYKGSDTRG